MEGIKMKALKLLSVTAFAVLVSGGLMSASARADVQADRDAYQRKINQEVQDLQQKISEAREDYKEDGMRVDQRIKTYEDRINEIKRESDDKIKNMDVSKDNSISDRVSRVRHDFQEWRLKRAINSYDDKIEDLRIKARDAANPN